MYSCKNENPIIILVLKQEKKEEDIINDEFRNNSVKHNEDELFWKKMYSIFIIFLYIYI